MKKKTVTFPIRNLPVGLKNKFKAKVARNNHPTMSWVIRKFMQLYISDEINIE